MSSILITGGTGSFGKAFTKHLLKATEYGRICIYSRGEHAQASMREELGDPPSVRWMIGDVRDGERLKRAARDVDIIVHAAALKRIEVGNYNPDEMVKTNILGTMNVIEAALANRVSQVIGLSSDKAFQPVSPYGQSKALAESLLLAANTMHGAHGPRFAITRYGNVWGSAGSVVPKWRDLIAKGAERLPVTDPQCTRFFMTMDQAVELVWNLLLKMRGGEVEIPTWLPAYSLGDLAEAFDMPITITGLPAWEKKHEAMCKHCFSCMARRMSVEELRGWLSHA